MYFEFLGTNVRILGSMHLLPADTPLPLWVQRAYEWSEQLVFESDPNTLLPHLRSSPPFGLSQHLSKSTLNTLQRLWVPMSPLLALDDAPPWAALILSSVLALRTFEGVEPRFLSLAASEDKAVHFLENASEFQVAMDTAPTNDVLRGIESLVAGLSSVRRSFVDMHRAWIEKDLRGVHDAASRSPSFEFPTIRRAALETRNFAWAPKLRQFFHSPRRTLVAVGALHLCEPASLLTLLGHKASKVRDF